MNSEQIASKANLIKAKEELKLLDVGLDILDKKRKALMNAHESKIKDRDSLNKKVNQTMNDVSHSFNKAMASIGQAKLESLAGLIPCLLYTSDAADE